MRKTHVSNRKHPRFSSQGSVLAITLGLTKHTLRLAVTRKCKKKNVWKSFNIFRYVQVLLQNPTTLRIKTVSEIFKKLADRFKWVRW